jgi:hypothetical protein
MGDTPAVEDSVGPFYADDQDMTGRATDFRRLLSASRADRILSARDAVWSETCEILTWTACPQCGGLAALGTQPTPDGGHVTIGCTAGCTISTGSVADVVPQLTISPVV